MNRNKGNIIVIETEGRESFLSDRESRIQSSAPLPPLRQVAPDHSFRKGEPKEKDGCIRVLIVDSCSLGAIGIGEILKSRWKDVRVSHARTGCEIKSLLLKDTWDIVIFEIGMADQSGLELMMRTRSMAPGVRLLAMSSGEESVQGLQALRAGSAGFLHRGGSAEDLLKAVEQVLSGRHYVSRRLANTLARKVDDLQRPTWEELDRVLSPREAQILQALAEGESIKHIGRRLGISPKTVSTYRRRILDKMHFQNDADIVKYWWAKGGVALCP
jgi:DNA-binding NarL/FixJ family response regulator